MCCLPAHTYSQPQRGAAPVKLNMRSYVQISVRAVTGGGRAAGIVFVGGFSYADVMESAKGWAGTIRFSDSLRQQFEAFYARPDTFSLGICNGCQLMALLGWVPGTGQQGPLPDTSQPRFVHNSSGRCVRSRACR